MRYTEISTLKPSVFKRLIGVHLVVFETMVEFVKNYKLQKRKHPTRGVKSKLSVEDEVLMMLMYYREYRTFLHAGTSYGVSETQCWRIVTNIETILLQSPDFHIPGKKALYNSENSFEIIVVDVSEHPVERPKKNREIIIPAKRNGIL